MSTCPVCTLPLPDGGLATGGRRVDCLRCGSYAISEDALEDLPSLLRKNNAAPLLSYFIRRMSGGEKRPKLTSEIVTRIAEQERLPNPAEQADNLVIALGTDLGGDPGRRVRLNPQAYMARAGAASADGLNFLVGELVGLGLIEGTWGDWKELGGPIHIKGQLNGRLTLRGWERFEHLRTSGGVGSTAFLAMKFGDAELDKFEPYLRLAVGRTGFTVRRLDDQPKAGLIDDRLRVEIRRARFLLADLTHANNGAYWEAGFAEGLGKPVIYLCKRSVFQSVSTHFDTNHQLTIPWDLTTVPEDMEKLKATIRYSIPEARQVD